MINYLLKDFTKMLVNYLKYWKSEIVMISDWNIIKCYDCELRDLTISFIDSNPISSA